ncbi:hypothetical protein [uncultured Thiocystis sp.]|jgi:hypothetical protein|uniref:hypothetical protein n=1 Tax=uncultured Thiocystis sp. TaxID=1202134 RepID=UPI0025E0D213|nr:hypothetical protein [uncultured Thiocystis sp.]
MPPAHHILIGTPAYAGMVHLDYLASISEYFRADLNFSVAAIGNESLITRARNAILSKFHEEMQYTHLLFLDGDVFLSAEGLMRLLAHEVDVIGAAVPLKGFNQRGERIFNIGACLGERGGLHEIDRIGTAALMLSRQAVGALVAEAREAGRTYGPQLSRGTPLAQVHFDVFQVGVVGGDYLSEDYWVCHRLRQLGYRVFVDPEVATRHQGVTEF